MSAPRIWDRVTKTDGCWSWSGATTRGYGVVRANGVLFYVHRLAWEEANGPIPDGLLVLHRCDNPPCVRPNHLFLGTQADNMLDAAAKGRTSKGEDRSNHKATEAQVREMRRLRGKGWNARQMAHLFPIGERTIRKILSGKNWRHVA